MGEDVNPEEQASDDGPEVAGPGARGEGRDGVAHPDGTLAPGEEPDEADFLDPAVTEVLGSRRRESWRRRTASGAILSGLALGFQQVFEDKREDVSVIMETSGVPPTDLPVEAEFDGMAPKRSVVRIRPWLLSEADPDESQPDELQPDESQPGGGTPGEAATGEWTPGTADSGTADSGAVGSGELDGPGPTPAEG